MTVVDSLHGCQVRQFSLSYVCFVKEKAFPIHAWTGPQDVRRLRLPDIKTIKVVALPPPRKIFLVLISVKSWVRLEGLCQWKNYIIENRTHDLSACIAAPQSTAPPRVPNYSSLRRFVSWWLFPQSSCDWNCIDRVFIPFTVRSKPANL